MFCCGGSKCLDDGEIVCKDKDKGRLKQQNQQIYLQHNGIPSGRGSGKLNSNMLNYMPKYDSKLLKPEVNHTADVRRDIYVKLNGEVRKVGSSKTVGYQGGHYRLVQMPKSHSAAVRQTPKRAPISELNPAAVVRVEQRQAETFIDRIRLSTEFKVSSEDNRTSTPIGMTLDDIEITGDDAVAIFDNKDSESLIEEQKDALDQLENMINGYQIDDEETPMVIADVLPKGAFKDFKTENTASLLESSEDEPCSRSSSLSNKSINSRTGIISQRHPSIGSKKNRNSVSFKLPVDHVDKPYAPMQTSGKAKQTALSVKSPPAEDPTICISGSSMNVWHSGNTVYVEHKHKRRMSGPFKGSFKSLFYGKYSNADLSGYKESNFHLAPKIMERVTSFENLRDGSASVKYLGNPVVVRRNTFR